MTIYSAEKSEMKKKGHRQQWNDLPNTYQRQ